MKNCDENTKLDDSFATNKKMSLWEIKVFRRRNILHGTNVLKHALCCL